MIKVRCRLQQIMDERGVKQGVLHRETKLNQMTISKLRNNFCGGIEYRTMEILLDYFSITIDELFEVVEE